MSVLLLSVQKRLIYDAIMTTTVGLRFGHCCTCVCWLIAI